MVFKGQGQIILNKAEALGESVGAAHLGFMAEVQEEMKVCVLCFGAIWKRLNDCKYPSALCRYGAQGRSHSSPIASWFLLVDLM